MGDIHDSSECEKGNETTGKNEKLAEENDFLIIEYGKQHLPQNEEGSGNRKILHENQENIDESHNNETLVQEDVGMAGTKDVFTGVGKNIFKRSSKEVSSDVTENPLQCPHCPNNFNHESKCTWHIATHNADEKML